MPRGEVHHRYHKLSELIAASSFFKIASRLPREGLPAEKPNASIQNEF